MLLVRDGSACLWLELVEACTPHALGLHHLATPCLALVGLWLLLQGKNQATATVKSFCVDPNTFYQLCTPHVCNGALSLIVSCDNRITSLCSAQVFHAVLIACAAHLRYSGRETVYSHDSQSK